jgi:outer membrane protein insertion porin family
MEGLTNLYNLQYFSAVTPETPPGSADALMDLVINVEEQLTTEVQFGFTFSGTSDPDQFPVSVMAKWNDRNFRGTGNMMGAEITASPDTQSLTTQYTHRWIFGLPFSLSFDVSYQHSSRRAAMNNSPPFFDGDEDYAFPDGFVSREDYDAAGRIPPDEYIMPYDQHRLSLGISSGYRWATVAGNLGLGGGFRVGGVLNSFNDGLYRPFDPILRAENNQWTPATSFWTSISLDRRDIFYDPSRGYYGVLRGGYYGIIPSVEHEFSIRSDTKAEWFHTLLDLPVTETWNFRLIFGIHSGVSFIFPQFQGEPKIEEANMLAVDGMFVGRGWMSEYRRKGNVLFENWAELRVPLVPGLLAWDFFFDAAGVKRTPGD